MGRDKALLPFRGGHLGRSVAEAVERAAGSVVLVGNLELARLFGYPAIPDGYPGEGPLGGILTALEDTSSDWNLVAACDMPGLSAEFLNRLLDIAAGSDADAVLPAGPGGRPEPLCAVYHRRSRDPLSRAFARGVRKIAAALENLPVYVWPVAETAPFQNVNTPEDWAPWAPRHAAN
jgi:molybdenum cofactor guanylyltransferase